MFSISIPAYLNELVMDKLQLTGQNLGWVFIFRSGHLHAAKFLLLWTKLLNLQLKTRPKLLLGSLPLVITLPGHTTLQPELAVRAKIQSSYPTSYEHTIKCG